jgi:cell division protease FtsH
MSEQPKKPNPANKEQGPRRSSLPFAIIFISLLVLLAVMGSDQNSKEISEDAFLYELYTGQVSPLSEDRGSFSGELKANAKRVKAVPFTVVIPDVDRIHSLVRSVHAKAQKLEPQPIRLEQFQARYQSGELQPKDALLLTIRQPVNAEDPNGLPVKRERLLVNYVDSEGSHYTEVIGDNYNKIDLKAAYSMIEGAGGEVETLYFDEVNPLITVEESAFKMFLWTFGPILLFLLVLWWFMSRQMRGQGQGLMSFGRSRATVYNTENRTGVTFANVAGIEEAKEEVGEIIQFLKFPEKFKRLGGRIPRGVLLVGSPGTGKTLLAKAIAGEADVPFISISGSDFVEMFVGVGASRVRDLFEQARKAAPCIIFLDEIDAVGRKRGTGMGGGNDEREQTLNAILVEMDGFGTDVNIIVIAATNRPDVLDPALLRPGRFDREIVIDLPDVVGREAILKVHTKGVKLAPEVELASIARGTPGFSGAELAALVNEGAILAAMREHAYVRQDDLEEARDKVRFGRAKKSRVMDLSDKRITAYHEAGHALVNMLLEHTEPLHKVTIIPRGMALGVTMMLPEKDRLHMSRKQILDDLAVSYGGRIAEHEFCDDITSGATSDIQHATRMARAMVTRWGMSEDLGPINLAARSGSDFLGNEYSMGNEHSQETARRVDAEIERILNEAHQRAEDIIKSNRDAMERITAGLLEFETLSGKEVQALYDGTEVKDLRNQGGIEPPPLPPTAPATPPTGVQIDAPPQAPPAPPLPPGAPRPGNEPA